MAQPISVPRWQRRPDDRPDEILDAAMSVFGEVGFARAKLDEEIAPAREQVLHALTPADRARDLLAERAPDFRQPLRWRQS